MCGISEQRYRTNPQQVPIAVSRIDRFHELDVLTATNKERFVTRLTDNFTLLKKNVLNVRKIKHFNNLYKRIIFIVAPCILKIH
jgi:hypothetical protein